MIQQQVSFKDAVVRALTTNYCNFSGRSSRSEFWWFMLFANILGTIVAWLTSDNPTTYLISMGALNLILLLPTLSLWARRLHDINKSGWYLLLCLIPLVGIIILIVWACKDSEHHPNNYGPEPNVE